MIRANEIEIKTVDMPWDINVIKWKAGVDCSVIEIYQNEIAIRMENGHWINYPKHNIIYFEHDEIED
jgi:hypothetical protein